MQACPAGVKLFFALFVVFTIAIAFAAVFTFPLCRVGQGVTLDRIKQRQRGVIFGFCYVLAVNNASQVPRANIAPVPYLSAAAFNSGAPYGARNIVDIDLFFLLWFNLPYVYIIYNM